MISKLIKPGIFLIIFSSCYFISCLTFLNMDRSPCEETCSQNNIECSRNCEDIHRSYMGDNLNTPGTGCDGNRNNCMQRCEEIYQRCMENCDTSVLEK